VLTWVIALIPFAVFGVVARAVGEHSFAPLKGPACTLPSGCWACAARSPHYQAWLVIFAKRSLVELWREAKEPVIYAMGANSSLATLPVTLRALDRLGVSKQSSTLGAVVGTNFHNDGIILYEGMAVLFVAQASGIDLSVGQQILAAASCMVAAMGVAGVPEAGFISLALVLNTVGLPIEILPLLLTVDWIIARARSVTNVLSDMMLSILVDGPPAHPDGRDARFAPRRSQSSSDVLCTDGDAPSSARARFSPRIFSLARRALALLPAYFATSAAAARSRRAGGARPCRPASHAPGSGSSLARSSWRPSSTAGAPAPRKSRAC
jgi:hypothetical protein